MEAAGAVARSPQESAPLVRQKKNKETQTWESRSHSPGSSCLRSSASSRRTVSGPSRGASVAGVQGRRAGRSGRDWASGSLHPERGPAVCEERQTGAKDAGQHEGHDPLSGGRALCTCVPRAPSCGPAAPGRAACPGSGQSPRPLGPWFSLEGGRRGQTTAVGHPRPVPRLHGRTHWKGEQRAGASGSRAGFQCPALRLSLGPKM